MKILLFIFSFLIIVSVSIQSPQVSDMSIVDIHISYIMNNTVTHHDNIDDSVHTHTHKHSEDGEEHEHNHDHNSTTQLNLKLFSKYSILFIDSLKDEGRIKFPFKSMTLSEYQLSIYRPPIS